ncbi:MAG TPA: putative peptidoglycan glycosyltransferase FtsW [Coleofasciculaceae cyanobacterium]|jgi:cell division protein FtsW
MDLLVKPPGRASAPTPREVERPPEREGYGDGGGIRRVVATRSDQTLVYITLSLVLVGLMSVFTASAAQADLETGNSIAILFKQVLSAILGGLLLVAMSRFSFERLKFLAHPLAFASIGLLLLTMLVGTTANGSERWIMLPFGFQFQPSDLAKVAAILLMAQATSQPRLFNGTGMFNLALITGMIALIYQQPNLSVSMILGMMTVAMLFVAGLSLHVLVPSLCGIAYVVSKKVAQTPYQMERITGWIDPWRDPLDTGYNLIQSYYAVGAGGLFGAGLGNSIQKLYYLPFQHTDFIFSVICEEWGFFGAAIVLGLFGLLAWRGFTIAWQCPSHFGRMLAFGLTLAITLQAIINICVTIGLMPVTGVTLPLISYGGTSMIVTLGMIGILLNISRYRTVQMRQQLADLGD